MNKKKNLQDNLKTENDKILNLGGTEALKNLNETLSKLNFDSENQALNEIKKLIHKRDIVFGTTELDEDDKKFLENNPNKEVYLKLFNRLKDLLNVNESILEEINLKINKCNCEESKCELTSITKKILENNKIKVKIPYFVKKDIISKEKIYEYLEDNDDPDIIKELEETFRKLMNYGGKDFGLVTVTQDALTKKLLTNICDNLTRGNLKLLIAIYLKYCFTKIYKMLSSQKKNNVINKIIEIYAKKLNVDITLEEAYKLNDTNFADKLKNLKKSNELKTAIENYLRIQKELGQIGELKFKQVEIDENEKTKGDLIKFINGVIHNYQQYFSELCGGLEEIKNLNYGKYKNMGIKTLSGGDVDEYTKTFSEYTSKVKEYNEEFKKFLQSVEDFKTNIYQLYYYGNKNLKSAIQVGLFYLFVKLVATDNNQTYKRYLNKEDLKNILASLQTIKNPYQKITTSLYIRLVSSALKKLEENGNGKCIDLLFSGDYFHLICAQAYVNQK